MQCPYCKEEMRQGYIPMRYALEWVPIGQTPQLNYKKDESNGFKTTPSFWDSKKMEADYCPHCKKLVIDLDRG